LAQCGNCCQNPLDEFAPVLLCVPKDFRRQITARRSGRSAALFSAANPGTRVKVQREASKLNKFRQVLSVFLWPQLRPAFSNAVTAAFTGSIPR
jgi:hypothetical protein